MPRRLLLATALLISSLLTGCGIIECQICGGYDADTSANASAHTSATASAHTTVGTDYPAPVTITATGYGALDPALASNPPQQELMALRASEVEAYRTLAERVRGVEITADTRVADFLTAHDRIFALVDTFVLAKSRVISQGVNRSGYFETTVALSLDTDFYRDPVATMEAEVNNPVSKSQTLSPALPRTASTSAVHFDTGAYASFTDR
ncbi:hypothetical protein [Gilvimarinus xylanilyticus]|uniref:FlgO domain-containing protein n=1 Tax=Gilvimarinus xylanilyticus TaxID=2944139 RepID=A0A9X2I3V1_9GAMM|nr:hypothetical protein [Gilvimarinus xylanilyticus]MCP8899870.1 hypothetical protein [Gilvimarinus xylanilyticus]